VQGGGWSRTPNRSSHSVVKAPTGLAGKLPCKSGNIHFVCPGPSSAGPPLPSIYAKWQPLGSFRCTRTLFCYNGARPERPAGAPHALDPPSSFHRSPVPPRWGVPDEKLAEVAAGRILNSPLRHGLYRPRGPLSPRRPLFAPSLLAPALLPPALREPRLLFVRSEAELRLLALRLVALVFVPNWPDIFLSVRLALARAPSLRVADMPSAELLRIPLAWVLAR
jgi:hypothetical protein